MKDTRIRWAEHTWNPMTGCTKISPGCDHCYAETLTTRYGPTSTAFPNGFTPTFKPHKIADPSRWRAQARVFVNSMSDLFHQNFTTDQVDQVFDAMLATDRHDYMVLTKRPPRMRAYLVGRDGWLERRGIDVVPDHIWLGTSIESDRYTYRADHIRRIPAGVRFLSCEPLLGPMPSLDLDGIQWVIVGGESGPGHRPMDDAWATDLRDRSAAEGIAFFFKQHPGYRTEMGIELEGRLHDEYPLPHPSTSLPRVVGRYVGRHESAPAFEFA